MLEELKEDLHEYMTRYIMFGRLKRASLVTKDSAEEMQEELLDKIWSTMFKIKYITTKTLLNEKR